MKFTDNNRTLNIRIVDTAPHGDDLTDTILGGMGIPNGDANWIPDLYKVLNRASNSLNDPERVLRATWTLSDSTGTVENGWRQTGGDYHIATRTATTGSIGGHQYTRPAENVEQAHQ